MYPTLAEIFPKVASPFVIGVYHGLNKPNDCNDFLEDFINEYKTLHLKGFEYNHNNFFVKIRGIVCDTPARSYLIQSNLSKRELGKRENSISENNSQVPYFDLSKTSISEKQKPA